MPHSFVTGATGFVGRFLVPLLLERGHRVTALVRAPRKLPRGARVITSDIARLEGKMLRGGRFDFVFHLAGISNVPVAQRDPHQAFTVNTLGTARLYHALDDAGLRPRVVFVGSSDVYAPSPRKIKEDRPLRMANPYSTSKACAEMIGRLWCRGGWDIVLLRPFNQIGPGQSTDFVAPSFAQQIAEAEAGLRPALIRVGNLTPRRDFTDVRDMARAYLLAAERCVAGEVYNIGSGRSLSIGELLRRLLRLSTVRLRVERERSRARADARTYRVSASDKFRRATGWRPEIPLGRTLKDLLEFHRARVAESRRK